MSVSGQEIKQTIFKYAEEAFGFDFQEYLNKYSRDLFGVSINSELKKFEHLFGNIPSNFLPTINTQFHDTIAGYKVDVGAHFTSIGIDADVFLLNKANLDDSDKDIDSLIIHELCHMLIDSNYLHHLKINLSSKDKYHGNKLYKKTDIINERMTKHTENFCHLLSWVSEIISKRYDIFTDRWDVINSAMRYDLMGSLRKL